MLRKVWSDDSGQDLVEYALIAGLVSIIAVASISAAGTTISQIWDKIKDALDSANVTPPPAP